MSESTAAFEGRCHCGAVTVRVPRAAAFGVVACHCQDCQRLHGNFFALLAADRAAVDLGGEKTQEALVHYASSATVTRSFCRHCGSRVAKDAHGSPKLLLAIGLFGAETGLAIRKNLWLQSKPDWYDAPSPAVTP